MAAENKVGQQENPYQNFLENRDAFYSRLIHLTHGVSALEQAIISFEALNKRTGSLKKQLETAQKEKVEVEGDFPPEVLKTGQGDQSRSVIDQIREDAEKNPELKEVLNIPSRPNEDDRRDHAPEQPQLTDSQPDNEEPQKPETKPDKEAEWDVTKPVVEWLNQIQGTDEEKVNLLSQLTSSTFGGLLLFAIRVPRPVEDQARLVEFSAREMIKIFSANPQDFLEKYRQLLQNIQAESNQSALDILAGEDRGISRLGLREDRGKLVDFKDEEEWQDVWQERFKELQETSDNKIFSRTHLRWLDFLSHGFDLPGMRRRFEELEDQTPQAGEGGNQSPNEPPDDGAAPAEEQPEPEPEDPELKDKKEAMERARDEYFEAMKEARENQDKGWLSRLTRGRLKMPFRRGNKDKIAQARQKYLDARNDFGAYSAVDRIKKDPEFANWDDAQYKTKLTETAIDILSKNEILTSQLESQIVSGRSQRVIENHKHWIRKTVLATAENALWSIGGTLASTVLPVALPVSMVIRAVRGSCTYEPLVHKLQDRLLGADPNQKFEEANIEDIDADVLRMRYSRTYAARLRYGLAEATAAESVMRKGVYDDVLNNFRRGLANAEIKKETEKKALWQTLLDEVKQEKYNIELLKLHGLEEDENGKLPRMVLAGLIGIGVGKIFDWAFHGLADIAPWTHQTAAVATQPSQYGVKHNQFINPDNYINKLYGTNTHSSLTGFEKAQLVNSNSNVFSYHNPNFNPADPNQIAAFDQAWFHDPGGHSPQFYETLIDRADSAIEAMNPSSDFSNQYSQEVLINHFTNGIGQHPLSTNFTDLLSPDNTTLFFNDLAKTVLATA